MFDTICTGEELSDALQLLQELELNQSDDVRKQRAHARHQVAIELVVRPANSSDRHLGEYTGRTADISEGGCQTVLSRPCHVGDVYFIEFAGGTAGLPEVFARCLRCRLIREDAFEVGFCFFTPVVLPASLQA